jgi:pyruvate dehydrogenase E2 component (dihydrolipoamide acetyltransferase)
MALGTWRASRDGRLYGRVVIDATELVKYVEAKRSEESRVTVTAVVGAAAARAIRAVPEANTRVVLGRIVPHRTCDVSFAVDVNDGTARDLAPIKVERVDEKSVAELARELGFRVPRLRERKDPSYKVSSSILRWLPQPLVRPALTVVSLLTGGFGVPLFGQPGYPLGTALVSNVGSFGLDEGFMAPVPWARASLYVLVGAVRDAPAVVDGALAVRPQLVVTCTADHRLLDGAQAGQLARHLKTTLEDPWSLP